ncbi:MAG: hypothetical protein WAW11_01545 [Patescibacteria group bacterium]
MDIVIDIARLNQFFNAAPLDMAWQFFVNIGWMIIGVVYINGALMVYKDHIQGKYAATLKNIILAVDIPKGNEQTPKAVENLFTYLGGAHGSISFFEEWFDGLFQQSFSFEIVSIEGYTQFLIRTPLGFRNLVESAVYSQYPDAEISEVDDYTSGMPTRFPDEEWDIWGAEYIQHANIAYPIKLYEEFEHKFGESETQFKDPMAALMDLCSSLRQGEQLWVQLIVVPCDFAWVKKSDAEVDKILKKVKVVQSGASKFVEWIGELSEYLFAIWGDIEPAKEAKALSMMELTPAQKKKIEAIHAKAAKLGFQSKMRVIYIAKKDVLNKGKVVSGFTGYIKQFATMDLNNIKPDMGTTGTKTAYFAKDSRLIGKKNRLMSNYVARSAWSGRLPGLYNIEELATLWHFPLEANVKAPLIQKAPGRKSDAPASLPIFEEESGGQNLPPDIFGLTGEPEVKNNEKVENIFSDNTQKGNDDLFWVEESGSKQKTTTNQVANNTTPNNSNSSLPPDLPFA